MLAQPGVLGALKAERVGAGAAVNLILSATHAGLLGHGGARQAKAVPVVMAQSA